MSQVQRPLSPHLQVYKWQLTMATSIVHRATGIALAVGTILLVWWLLAAATSADAFSVARAFWSSWIGLLLLLGWTWSFSYHLSNGIRHLFWDAGYGYDLKTAYASGYAVAIGSVVLTALIWIAAFVVQG
jgi:succinate dehydrogenase / fumarate reductase cytochrome b subunit